MSGPIFLRRRMSLAAILMLFSGVGVAAEIKSISKGPISVIRGDTVNLQIELSTTASANKTAVEWWSNGGLVCQSAICKIDTSTFREGDYYYDVIAMDSEGIAMSRVGIQAQQAMPLYTPKTIDIPLESSSGNMKTAKHGDWMIVERAGGITYPTPSKALKIARIRPVDIPIEGVRYSVPSGAQAVVRRIGVAEQWLVSAKSMFEIKDGRFHLLTGNAIWRKLSEEVPASSKAWIAGVGIEAEGSAFLAVEITESKPNRKNVTVRNFESKSISLICSEKQRANLVQAMSRSFVVNRSGDCKYENTESADAGDPSVFIEGWSPWWIKDQSSMNSDRWRIEWSLMGSTHKPDQLLELAQSARGNGACADVLDLIGARQAVYLRDAKILHLLGECRFELGMYDRSVKTFAELAVVEKDPSWSYYMRARAYRYLKQYNTSLEWFDKAQGAGYKNTSELAREAAETAQLAGKSRERLLWLEAAWMNEKNPSQQTKDWDQLVGWRRYRPMGAVFFASFQNDSHVIPINLDEFNNENSTVTSSRSYVMAVEANWWKTFDIAQNTKFKTSGNHSLWQPYNNDISIANRFIHDFGFDFILGEAPAEVIEPSDRWVIDIGGRLGTGFSGGERQRDRIGWVLEATRPLWMGLQLGLESNKFLDPRPGGRDVIDVDLERYTGAGDHSHLDFMFYAGLNSEPERLSWNAKITAGQVDYRTSTLDRYDHVLLKAQAEMSWQLIPPRITVSGSPMVISRSYKNGEGSDLTLGLNSSLAVRILPLWQVSLLAGVESRSASQDPSTSWLRYRYGLGVLALL